VIQMHLIFLFQFEVDLVIFFNSLFWEFAFSSIFCKSISAFSCLLEISLKFLSVFFWSLWLPDLSFFAFSITSSISVIWRSYFCLKDFKLFAFSFLVSLNWRLISSTSTLYFSTCSPVEYLAIFSFSLSTDNSFLYCSCSFLSLSISSLVSSLSSANNLISSNSNCKDFFETSIFFLALSSCSTWSLKEINCKSKVLFEASTEIFSFFFFVVQILFLIFLIQS